MLLENIINKIFIGVNISENFSKKEINDYLYLTINNVDKNSFFGRDEDRYISYKRLKKHESINQVLQYGDFIIFRKNNEFCILRFANQINNKIIPSDDFIILRTVGGGYFKNFIYDIDGKFYFKDELNKLFKNNSYKDFVKNIGSIDIPLTSDLKPNEDKKAPVNVKELPLDPSKIDVRAEKIALASIISRMKREAIDMFTDFQRLQNLWEDDVKSRFIESLLVKFPIPSFYFDCTNSEKWLVIDGLQRLSTLQQFIIDKTLELKGLEFLTHLNNKKYEELSINDKSIIDETNITTIQIHSGTPARVKYSLFERINKNGKPLTPQELRHAINSVNDGKPVKYIKTLTAESIFIEIWGNRKKDRMQDRETVLSYVAFRIFDFKKFLYNEKKVFLDEAMSKIYEVSKHTLDNWLFDFRKALLTAKKIFGIENVFRKKIKVGKNLQLRFSNHLFEIWTYALATISEEDRQKLIEEKDFVKKLFQENLLIKDEDFIDAINENQYHPNSISIRFGKILELINQIIK